MNKSLSNRVLALAGVVQAAALVNDIATGQRADEQSLNSTLSSILKTEPVDVADVYGGLRGLGFGLQRLIGLLGDQQSSSDVAVLRYTLSLMQLQGKVMRRRILKQVLEDGIRRAREQFRHFGPTHANVLANLADTYLHSAGTIQPRIMVTGDAVHLQNQRIIDMVRSLLLGGLRSAVLWRQCGGSRWMLLFLRSSLHQEAKRLLRESGRYA
ncbi:MAG: high frequency lysogenization protein HflD [Gammaproteobacteria bacterium]|nr:high frequency lysogenization protein HflD [Gammaproteobacteria bacterium]MDE2346371.1 high frequency lysogenization protein HflD [Gammaproteobacteria bacterium]